MTVRVSSARFHTGSSPSEFDAARMPTAATANPAAATTPMSAAGSEALENTLRSRLGAASHMTPAMQIATATHPIGSSGSPSANGRHDGDEDHLGLGVHRADGEVAQVEGPQQRDGAEDLGAAGADQDQPEPCRRRRQLRTEHAERDHAHDQREGEAVGVPYESRPVERQRGAQQVLARGAQDLEGRGGEGDGDPHDSVSHIGIRYPICGHPTRWDYFLSLPVSSTSAPSARLGGNQVSSLTRMESASDGPHEPRK